MAFQFQCPNGHLLQGEESQAGQQVQCPHCQMMFIIPAPIAPAATSPLPGQIAPENPSGQSGGGFPDIHTGGSRAPAKPFEMKEPELLHIPCPNGHVLETPIEMLDQDVLCPHCQSQFQLRRKDSQEFKRKKQLERERREHRVGKAWFNWAVVVVVLVLLGLVVLIFSSSGSD